MARPLHDSDDHIKWGPVFHVDIKKGPQLVLNKVLTLR